MKYLRASLIFAGTCLAGSLYGQSITNGPAISLTHTSETVSVCIVGASTNNSLLTLYWSITNGFQTAAAWGNSFNLSTNSDNGCTSTNLSLTGRTTYYFNASFSNAIDGVVFGNSGSFTTAAFTNTVAGFTLQLTPQPLGPASNGLPGMISFDVTNVYICVATNTWKRAPIATWSP